jgi:hypothetical protein
VTLTFTPKSPEAGWEHFADWMKAQGLDGRNVRSITVHDDGSATAVLYERPLLLVGDEVATSLHHIDQITGPPPLHPSRPEETR